MHVEFQQHKIDTAFFLLQIIPEITKFQIVIIADARIPFDENTRLMASRNQAMCEIQTFRVPHDHFLSFLIYATFLLKAQIHPFIDLTQTFYKFFKFSIHDILLPKYSFSIHHSTLIATLTIREFMVPSLQLPFRCNDNSNRHIRTIETTRKT